METKRARIEGERQRTVDLVIRGVIGDDDAKIRISELKQRREEIDVELAELDEEPPVITLYPATLERYIKTVDALAVALAHYAAASGERGSLVQSFRALVHNVSVHPKGTQEGFEIEVKGKLAALFGGKAFPQTRYSRGRVVAEERFRQYSPATAFLC